MARAGEIRFAIAVRSRQIDRLLSAAVIALLLVACAAGSSGRSEGQESGGSQSEPVGGSEGADAAAAGSAGAAVATAGSAGTALSAGTSGTAVATGGSAGTAVSTGGSAGSAVPTGGSTGSAVVLELPVVRGDRCVLAYGSLAMEVASAAGGRITSLRLGTHELLTGASVNAINYGSTFWTSPQADWGWPPIAAIDSAAFTLASPSQSECALQGMQVADSAHPNIDGVQIEKHFSADLAADALVVRYTIANQGASARRLAPWEITRVAPGGLTFYASDGEPTGDRKPPTTRAGGCVWLEHGPGVAVDSKLFGDGKGWLAHVSPDNVLLLKVFDDVAAGAAASGEAEIELYSGQGYDEIEAQGSYAEIQPGAARDWTVRWYVRALPDGLARTVGNPELVAFVEGLL